MLDRELVSRVFDATVRVEQIVHVPTMLGVEPFDDWDDLFDSESYEAELAECLAVPADKAAQFFEELAEMRGAEKREAVQEAAAWAPPTAPAWFVLVSTPVMEKAGTGARFSWGHYRTKAFTGSTYEEALTKGVTWAELEYEAVISG